MGLAGILLPLTLGYVLFMLPTPSADTAFLRATSTPKQNLSTMPATTTQRDRAEVIANWFAPLTPLTLGERSLQASIADTEAEREQGLSDTPYIPVGIVKLFVFDTAAAWTFWMKDMRYPIDIIWLDEQKNVVFIAANLTPETYPKTVAPTSHARYVIETEAGFAAANHIVVGTKATW